MTQREIIKTLLAGEIPDRVGLNEHFWPFIVANGWDEQGTRPSFAVSPIVTAGDC